jgi:hypothetical protein
MNQNPRQQSIPAPCIIDTGTIVNKDDIKRLLNDLSHVRYLHTIDNKIQSDGKGWVLEVFSDPYQSTLIANGNLYLNIQSFDCLQLSKSLEQDTCFDLIQDNRCLRLIPLSNYYQEKNSESSLDAATIEAMMSDVLSARLDVQFDDDEF